MTGTLIINNAGGYPTLSLIKPAPGNTSNQLLGYTGANLRWAAYLGNGVTESGSNIGSDFAIGRFNDAGTFIDTPLTITRSTGFATFVGGSDNTITVNAPTGWSTVNLTSPAGQGSRVTGMRGVNARWELKLASEETESGGNAGSNFAIGRFNDAGAYLGAALQITRASGGVGLGILPPGNMQAGGIISTGQITITSGSLAGNLYYDSGGGTWRYLTAGGGCTFYMNPTASSFTWNSAPTGGTAGAPVTQGVTMFLDAAGNLQAFGATATKPGGGPWVAPSDVRLKQSIEPYTRGLEALLQLQPVTYEYNGEAGMPKDVRFHGLVADDVQPVMPEAVGRAVFGQRQAQGEDRGTAGEEYLTFDQTPLLFALINAVKELKAELDELRATVRPTRSGAN
jgi:Chaperone of endosialidase